MAFLFSKRQREAAEDDLELFEMAAAERELESDSDELSHLLIIIT